MVACRSLAKRYVYNHWQQACDDLNQIYHTSIILKSGNSKIEQSGTVALQLAMHGSILFHSVRSKIAKANESSSKLESFGAMITTISFGAI